jgi:small subunit ribosomal protein S8
MNKLIILLNKIKNASLVNKEKIEMDRSFFLDSFIKLLYKEGLIQSFFFKKNIAVIFLRYFNEYPIFLKLKLLISSSYFNYVGVSDILKISNKKNIFIFSTSKGIYTDIDCKKKNIGGVLLCKI